MRFLTIALLAIAASASAQGTTKTPAAAPQTKQDAKAPATKQETKQDTKAAPTQTPGTKAAAPTQAPGTKAPAGGAQRRPALAIAPETAPVRTPAILREAYDYDAAGRRDPFFSLLASAELRPTVADLRLTSVLYHPSRPIAVMREVGTNTQYRVTLGTTLGRMRVILIKPRVVIFTIEEFGLNRQDSLVLGDTSKVRAR